MGERKFTYTRRHQLANFESTREGNRLIVQPKHCWTTFSPFAARLNKILGIVGELERSPASIVVSKLIGTRRTMNFEILRKILNFRRSHMKTNIRTTSTLFVMLRLI